jgi:hypothetical protein
MFTWSTQGNYTFRQTLKHYVGNGTSNRQFPSHTQFIKCIFFSVKTEQMGLICIESSSCYLFNVTTHLKACEANTFTEIKCYYEANR